MSSSKILPFAPMSPKTFLTGLVFLLFSLLFTLLDLGRDPDHWTMLTWLGCLSGGMGGVMIIDSEMLRGRDKLTAMGLIVIDGLSLIIFATSSENLTLSMEQVFLQTSLYAVPTVVFWLVFYRVIRLNWIRSMYQWGNENKIAFEEPRVILSRPLCWKPVEFLVSQPVDEVDGIEA